MYYTVKEIKSSEFEPSSLFRDTILEGNIIREFGIKNDTLYQILEIKNL